jgi:hypothetical protein
LIITLFFAFRVAREYRQPATVTQTIEMKQLTSDTLFLTLNDEFLDELLYNSYDYIEADEVHLVVTEQGEFYEQIEVDIDKADGPVFELTQHTTARGRSVRMAREKASEANWHYEQVENSLVLDPYFTLGEKGNWRAQHIRVKVKVPVGKYINIDENMREILNWHYHSPYMMAGKTWIMTEDGLRDPDEVDITIPTKVTEEETGSTQIIKPVIMQIIGFVW